MVPNATRPLDCVRLVMLGCMVQNVKRHALLVAHNPTVNSQMENATQRMDLPSVRPASTETNLLLVWRQISNVYAFWGARTVKRNVSRNQHAQLVTMGSINLTVPLHAPLSLGKNASNAIKTVEIASWQPHVLLANGK